MQTTELVPDLEYLRAQLLSPSSEEDAEQAGTADLDFMLEQLPYSLMAAYRAIQIFREQAEKTLAQCHVEGTPQPVLLMLNPEKRNELGFAIDSYFASVRRGQNSLCHYLSTSLKKSIPNSMAEIAKKVASGKQVATPAIDKIVTTYWNQSGKTIKQYRDLSEHNAVVASDARVVFLPDGRRALYLALPNNPGETSARRLTFTDPTVHALHFVVESFASFLEFLNQMTKELVSIVGKSEYMTVPFKLRGGLRVGGPHIGLVVPSQAAIDERLRANTSPEIPAG